ncbi:MAG: hypothetical protein Q9217_005608 [Psora testacea]
MFSIRQQKLARIDNPGADEKPQGEVRGIRTLLEWHDIHSNEWVPAVYHSTIRRQLLDRASNNGQHSYTQPRRRGLGVDDETAFHNEQKNWGGDRLHWGRIRDDVLNIFEGNGYVGLDAAQVPQDWYEGDRIVLDHDNHPLRVFRDLPLTLSTEVEGWLLEAYCRLDSRIERKDIRARMPRQRVYSDGRIVNLFGLSAIGNKRSRFRDCQNLASWEERSGTAAKKENLKKKMPPEAVAANTTKDCQALTHAQQKGASAKSKGVHPQKRVRREKKKGMSGRQQSKTTDPQPETTSVGPCPSRHAAYANMLYCSEDSGPLLSQDSAARGTCSLLSTLEKQSNPPSPTALPYPTGHPSPPVRYSTLRSDAPAAEDCNPYTAGPSKLQGHDIVALYAMKSRQYSSQGGNGEMKRDRQDRAMGDFASDPMLTQSVQWLPDFKHHNNSFAPAEAIMASHTLMNDPDFTLLATDTGAESRDRRHKDQLVDYNVRHLDMFPSPYTFVLNTLVEEGSWQHATRAPSPQSNIVAARKREPDEAELTDGEDSRRAIKRPRHGCETALWTNQHTPIAPADSMDQLYLGATECPDFGQVTMTSQQDGKSKAQTQALGEEPMESYMALYQTLFPGFEDCAYRSMRVLSSSATQVPDNVRSPLQMWSGTVAQLPTPPSTLKTTPAALSPPAQSPNTSEAYDYRGITPNAWTSPNHPNHPRIFTPGLSQPATRHFRWVSITADRF